MSEAAEQSPDGMAGKYPVKNGGPQDIQTAWKILAGGAPVAAAALVDIAENGKSEIAKVQAAQAVLDRVGLATPKERPSVHFTVIPKEYDEHGIGPTKLSPSEVVRGRLKQLGIAMKGGDGPAHPGDVVDGEAGLDGWVDWDTDDSSSGEEGDGSIVDAELVPMEEDPDKDPWA